MKKIATIIVFAATIASLAPLWGEDSPRPLSGESVDRLIIGKWNVKHVALEGTEIADAEGFEIWDEAAVFYADGDCFKVPVDARGGGDFIPWDIPGPCYPDRPFALTIGSHAYEILIVDYETLLVSDSFGGRGPTRMEVWKKAGFN